MTTPGVPPPDARARILTAAAQLLREGGTAAVTTRAVARAADVQAPTIYRHFGDKDGLLEAVAEHVMAGYVAETSTRTDDDPLADLRAAWHEHIAFGLANPDLYAMIVLPWRSTRSPATAAGVEILRARVHRLATAGLLRVDEHLATEMIHSAGSGTVLTLLGTPEAERDPDFAGTMLDAVLAAVLAREPSTPDTSTRAITVTFAATLPHLPGLTDAERAVLREWLDRALVGLRPSPPA